MGFRRNVVGDSVGILPAFVFLPPSPGPNPPGQISNDVFRGTVALRSARSSNTMNQKRDEGQSGWQQKDDDEGNDGSTE